MKTILHNARICNEGRIFEADILIDRDRIAQIDKTISDAHATSIDLNGRLLIPGMIDDQVHFREPGLTHKGEIETESRAAVAGGITSYFEMPNTIPNCLNNAVLEEKFKIAKKKSYANYSFYLGASNDNLEDIKKLNPAASCGIKIFMGASTGNMLVDKVEILEQIFKHSPTILVTHCEDTPTIQANEANYYSQYGNSIHSRFHSKIRSRSACIKSTKTAVDLAIKHHSNLHVLHISTEDEAVFLKSIVARHPYITAEVCVHHLFFNEADYLSKGNQIKCNPSIKSASDQRALIHALNEDCFSVIATDHAPHTWDEKNQLYPKAPSGLPLVQHALLMLLELVDRKQLSLEQLVKFTSHQVADRFQIKDRGYIREGYFADFAIVDLTKKFRVAHDNIFYKCKWSPLLHHEFPASIAGTMINGHMAFWNGDFSHVKHAQRIEFNRQ